jgi:hypothetical protein
LSSGKQGHRQIDNLVQNRMPANLGYSFSLLSTR